jgi:carboxymethylenebutenolidase
MNKRANTTLVTLLLLALGAGGQAFAQVPMEPGMTNVTFSGPGGVTLRGYLATPPGSGRSPAVLMIHEWWGLNRNIVLLADALAREGFVVLAADAFRGSVAQTAQEAGKQVSSTPAQQIAGDLDAALRFLRSNQRVDPERVASLGFCFGGTQSMYMGTRDPALAAVVIFYGPGPIQNASQLGSMREAGPVLGIYGKNDNNIPVAQVRGFEDAMDARNVESTITIYPGVGHAFVNSTNYNDGGSPGRAWNQMVDFLKDTLKR